MATYYVDEDADGDHIVVMQGDRPVNKREGMRDSIRKWRTIAEWMAENEGLVIDGGPDTCGLCLLYWANDCSGCPVYAHTGKPYCEATPYARYYQANKDADRAKAFSAAKAELKFLSSL